MDAEGRPGLCEGGPAGGGEPVPAASSTAGALSRVRGGAAAAELGAGDALADVGARSFSAPQEVADGLARF